MTKKNKTIFDIQGFLDKKSKEFENDYINCNYFSKYIGDYNLITFKERLFLPYSLIKESGVSGSETLEGNEISLNNIAPPTNPIYYRNAVLADKKIIIDRKRLIEACYPHLKNLAKELFKSQVLESMGQIITNNDSVVNYGVATEDELNIWNNNNQDRILYGSRRSNLVAGNHTLSLAAITAASDKISAGVVSLAKRMAKTADLHIRPIKTNDDEEWFVMFCDPFAFRDLKNDSTISQANREAWTRGSDNPIFTDGDLIYDGVIIKEIPEISKYSSGHIGVSFLCGQQSIVLDQNKKPELKIHNKTPSIAYQLKQQIRKNSFNNKQTGIITVFTYSEKD